MGLLGLKRAGARRMNEGRERAWREGCGCIWRQNGVWELDASGAPRLLRPDHFSQVRGRAVDFTRDYFAPFANRFAAAIREADPRAVIFLEAEPNRTHSLSAVKVGNLVYAPHWYDGYTLVKKKFNALVAADSFTNQPVFGPGAIRKSFAAQMATFKRSAEEDLGGVPTLIGEFGVPFDLEDKKAYRTGDYSAQVKALDRTFQAIEANLLSGTLWNYTPDNSNARGDQWNDEDLSIFSRDQQLDRADIHSGGRGLRAAVRPYALATAGELLKAAFDARRRVFELRFRHDPQVEAATEIFVPNYQYPQGYAVEVSDGTYEVNREGQRLVYRHSRERQEHTVWVRP